MIENASILNAQAIDFASKGEFDEAIACFKEAINLEKDNSLLWFNLGVTYRDNGDLIKARESLQKAHSLDQNDEEVLETLALLNYHLGYIPQALVNCAECVELNSSNSHIWNTIGVIYFNEKKYKEAADFFERAITINPYYYDALFNLRDTYQELGNSDGYNMCLEQLKKFKSRSE